MAFSNAIHHCERIGGYAQAVRHFEDTKRPRSARWQADERPLYKTSTHHYRLVRGPDGEYYDVTLYGTTMLRYMKPEDNGWEMCYLHYDSRRASREFFWRMFGRGYGNTTWFDVGVRHIPVSPYDERDVEINGVFIPSGFYAALCYDPLLHRFIKDRSAHRLVYAKVSSAEDKEDRARVRKAMEWIVDLMVMRLDTFHANAEVSMGRGRAFGGAKWNTKALTKVYAHRIEEQFADAAEIAKLEITAQEVYNVGLSKVAYAEGQYSNWTLDKPEEPLPVATFRKALMDKIVKLSGTAQKTGEEWLPLFPESLPNRYYAK